MIAAPARPDIGAARIRRDTRCALESRWITVGREFIHMRVSSHVCPPHRPPIVLLHGQGMSSLYMVPLARRLGVEFPTYAPDQPGFGRSAKPRRALGLPALAEFIIRWMDTMEMDSAVLLGNSFGCQVAVEAAVRSPDRIAGLVLQGPTTDASARNSVTQILRWIANSQREPPSTGTLVLDYSRAGLPRVWRAFRDAVNDAIETKLPTIRAPTLVVRGAKDAIVSQWWAETVTALLPNGHLVVVPGAAHTMNHHWDLELARVVRPFVIALDGGSRARNVAA